MSDFDPIVSAPGSSQPVASLQSGGLDPFNQAVVWNNVASNAQLAARSGVSGMAGFMSALAGGPLPTARAGENTGNIPVYNTGDLARPGSALRDTLTAGNAGSITSGLAAFIGNPYSGTGGGGEGTIAGYDLDPTYYSRVRQMGGRMGLDLSKYPNTDEGNKSLADYLNQQLSGYHSISGMSSGWDGSSGDPRSAATTLYQQVGDQLLPAMAPYQYSAPTSGSINRANNMETLTALSMMAPAFGGAAGVLGAGAEGTLSTGAGLGLTSGVASTIGVGATNALTNALSNYLFSGGAGGLQGVLSSLGGSALNAGANSLAGNTSSGLGAMFDTSGASTIGTMFNPIKSMGGMVSSLGLGGGLGAGMGLFSGLAGNGINSQTFAQIAGELGGGYIGAQIDPRLRNLGTTAGRDIARNLLQ